MTLSLRAFVDMRKENGGSLEDLSQTVEVVRGLLKTYGNKLMIPAVQELIAKDYSDVASVISLLHGIGKMNKKDLTTLAAMVA